MFHVKPFFLRAADGAGSAPAAPTPAAAAPAAPASSAAPATPAAPAASSPAPAPPAVAPPGFADTLPEDIRGEAAFRDIKDLAGLAKSYLNAQKMLGVPQDQLVRLPGPDDAAGWNDVYAKLGRPESADKYAAPKEMPEGFTPHVERQKGFFDQAHALGLTQRQAEGLYKWDAEYVMGAGTAAAAAQKAAYDQAAAKLRGDWGMAYEANLADGKAALAHYAGTLKLGDQVTAELDRIGLEHVPAVAKLFAHLGRQLKEDGALVGRGSGAQGPLEPTRARQEIAAKQQDPVFMKSYMEKDAAGHKEAVETMRQLYEQANPAAVVAA